MNLLAIIFGLTAFAPNFLVGYAASMVVEDRGPLAALAAGIAFTFLSIIPYLRWPILFGVILWFSPVGAWKAAGMTAVVAAGYYFMGAILPMILGAGLKKSMPPLGSLNKRQ